jgi:hypothetical protein
MTNHLWTWSGMDFGDRDGDELWTYDGRHVGRFRGHQVFASDGRYLGELRGDDRLITRTNPPRPRAGFTPLPARPPRKHYRSFGSGFVAPARFTDFPAPEELR